jgi:XTP/dITP diphosphohydrolase
VLQKMKAWSLDLNFGETNPIFTDMLPTSPSTPHKILIATGNRHKTDEFRAIFGSGWQVEDLKDHPELESPEETGTTFVENARIKALAASTVLGTDWLVLADDSGLEVDALGGRPGVYSARYAGTLATDAENRRKVLDELAERGARGKERKGRFRCVLVLARGWDVLGIFDGAVEGILANEEKGGGGFGYDPLFIPDGHCETFAQLPAEVKNGMSHRGRAAEKLNAFLAAEAGRIGLI